jgi:hypothetical protein
MPCFIHYLFSFAVGTQRMYPLSEVFMCYETKLRMCLDKKNMIFGIKTIKKNLSNKIMSSMGSELAWLT